MPQIQARTFGPLLGLFLADLFSKIVTDAKYVSYPPFPSIYDPSSWAQHHKPEPSYNHHYNQWYPIENPYHYETPNPELYPTLTTEPNHFLHEEPSSYGVDYETYYPEESKNHAVVTNIEKPDEDLVPSGSSTNQRRTASRYKRRGSTKRKYSQKRRRTTTPAYYDDDNYEDYSSERYNKRKRRRPGRDSNESYDENSYYDSSEISFKKQKRRPTRNKYKNQKRREPVTTQDSSYIDFDSGERRRKPQTEIVIVRQAQTDEPTTIITNGTSTTTQATTTTTKNSTNGYGPSNGHEGVSFTYGPPVDGGHYQYPAAPYVDWYTQDATRNAIVKRVHDIVSFDRKFNLK